MDYSSLSDEELRKKVIEAGLPCGPIIDSTRPVYIRKLQRIAGDQPSVKREYEPVDADESEDDPVSTPVTPKRPMTAKQRAPLHAGDSGSGSEVRQRATQRKKIDVKVEKEIESASSSGFVNLIVKLMVFFVLFAILYFVISSFTDQSPINLLSSSD